MSPCMEERASFDSPALFLHECTWVARTPAAQWFARDVGWKSKGTKIPSPLKMAETQAIKQAMQGRDFGLGNWDRAVELLCE